MTTQTASESGQIQNQYDYDIFGNPTLTVETHENAIRYAGEFYDKETGLYYLRARYYNPYIGRFISEDSHWGEDVNPLSLNLYTYAYNNPIKYVDPSGHIVSEADKKNLSKKDQKKIREATDRYNNAKTDAEREAAHRDAEAIRDKAGYSGGTDGSGHKSKRKKDKDSSDDSLDYDLPEWLDWDRDGVIDFDQEDGNTFDQDNNRIADWLEEDTDKEWDYNQGTGWDYVGKDDEDDYIEIINESIAKSKYTSGTGGDTTYEIEMMIRKEIAEKTGVEVDFDSYGLQFLATE